MRITYTIMTLALLLASCGRHEVREELRTAESIIENTPDSSLQIISTLDYNTLNDGSRALYGLIYTAGRYKCYLPVDTDTLIDFSIEYYNKTGDKLHLANAIYYKGSIQYNRKDYLASAKYLKQAEALSEKLDDELLRNKIYERLFCLNFDTNCAQLSLKYSKKLLYSSFRLKDSQLISLGFSTVATSYYQSGYADSAMIFVNKCLPALSAFAPKQQAEIYANIGALSCINGDTVNALFYIDKSMKLHDNAYAHYVLGDIEYNRRHRASAKEHWTKALDTEDEKLKEVVHECLAQYYSDEKDLDKQIEHTSKELEQVKKLQKTTKTHDVLQCQMAFEKEKSDKEHDSRLMMTRIVLLFAVVAFVSSVVYLTVKYRHRLALYISELKDKKDRIAEYENSLSAYKAELSAHGERIKKLKAEGRLQKQRLDAMLEEMDTLPQNVVNGIKKGAAIYAAIQEKQRIGAFSDEDISHLIDFFSIIEEKKYMEISKTYQKLTIRQFLFLIIEGMGYNDYEIADILSVTETAVRVTRSRIRKKKI